MTSLPLQAMAAPAAAGATLPYTEVQAENSTNTGTVIGPDRTRWTLAGESSGRRAVTLSATGQYVQFTVPVASNAIVVRYSMPDSADGTGITAPLSVYIDGTRQSDISLTSKYAWVYGAYPYNNNPGGGNAHRFYDEKRMTLPAMAAGALLKLQKDSTSTAASYTIDFVDFENVPAAISQPAGSVSVVSNGADPNGVNDSTAAIQNTVNANASTWIPAGTYKVTGHITVPSNKTIRGAGVWYTVLDGLGLGFFGSSSSAVTIRDFAMFGENTVRIDSDAHEAFGGTFGSGTTISNIWIEHTKVGAWLQSGTNGATFSGLRIRDTYADGVNFAGGVTNSTFTQSMIRNTGDDGMAMWSTGSNDTGNTFSNNTVEMPSIANNIGVYGGGGNTISNNHLLDTLWNGDGIQIANRFGSTAMTGTTTISGNTLERTGSYQYDFGWPAGAILLFAADSNLTATVNVTNNQIIDSNYAAMQFAGSTVTGTSFTTNTITAAGTYGLQVQSAGSASFSSVTATQLGVGGTYKCGTTFTINQGSGNSGWNTTPVCPASWPNPVYAPIATSTPTRTNTPSGPTNTPTRTNTPGGPTNTPTRTPTRTSTPTNTPAGGQSPYGGTAWAIPGTIQAENYDLGGETVAYHDAETANQGGQYRTADGVDIEVTTDTGGGYNVGWTRTDEWMEYTVNVASTGTYTLTERVASGAATGSFRVEFNGVDKTGIVAVPNTGGWQTWANLSQTVSLSAGQQIMRIYWLGNDTNLNYVSLSSGSGPTATPSVNRALNRPVTASSVLSSLYAAAYAVDGNQGSYWESVAGFPQTLTVDLGSNYTVSRVVLKLPAGWTSRNETLSILGSTDNVSYATIVGSAVYTIAPSANTVTINFSGTSRRYIRLNITANTGNGGGQISELEVY